MEGDVVDRLEPGQGGSLDSQFAVAPLRKVADCEAFVLSSSPYLALR